jgi:hypothetical protein
MLLIDSEFEGTIWMETSEFTRLTMQRLILFLILLLLFIIIYYELRMGVYPVAVVLQ